MTTANRTTPASIAELFTQYLKGQVTAREEGLGLEVRDGEVVPFDAVPVQPVDPKQAWDDGITAAKLLAADVKAWPIPNDWPGLVNAQEPAVALAFCVGNFPQIVRNLQPFLAGGNVAALRVNTGQPTAPGGLLEWASKVKEPAQFIVAAGALRLTRHFDEAESLLKRVTSWPALVANERVALAWHRGQFEEAAAQWRSQAPLAPVLFNRGMAALFLGDAASARLDLGAAVKQLPETSAWHHLGQLYLALAANRG